MKGVNAAEVVSDRKCCVLLGEDLLVFLVLVLALVAEGTLELVGVLMVFGAGCAKGGVLKCSDWEVMA